jgi:flagellar basal-body rod protein FlgC
MNAAMTRFSNAVSNMVNVGSTGKLPSTPNERATSYYPTDVISLSNNTGDNHLGVRTQTVERANPYTVQRDETSPYANEQGLIAAPNIDLTAEVVDTMMAELTYKANAKVIAAQKRIEDSLLDTMA